jgi:hypothetical protein
VKTKILKSVQKSRVADTKIDQIVQNICKNNLYMTKLKKNEDYPCFDEFR